MRTTTNPRRGLPLTYRQEIARLRRRNRELQAALDGLRAGVPVPTQGVHVPLPPPERDAVRAELEAREAKLRALDNDAWVKAINDPEHLPELAGQMCGREGAKWKP